MKNLIQIDPIAVKDKRDVVKALTILEKIGIVRMSEKEKETYLTDNTRQINNNFMIQEDDDGFRIQSHYLGHGISMKNLEKQIDEIINKYPNICEKVKEIKNKQEEIINEIENIKKEFTKEIQIKNENLKTVEDSLTIIFLKE
jgi:vacuolar-type H+-ATPase subunit I/STV1